MHRENGNVLFYIMIAVVLLGALSYVMTRGAGDSAAGMSATRISEDIKSQAQTIRAAILECNLVYNNGYPPEPANPYLVENLQCQVDSTPTYQDIFTGNSNRFLPVPPKPFVTGWTYRIDTATTP